MPRDLISRSKPLVLRPVHPNAGSRAMYQKRMDRLIDAMHRSLMRWLPAAVRRDEPLIIALAQDELPAVAIRKVMQRLSKYWRKKFDEASWDLGDWFAKDVELRTQAALRRALRNGGFSVKFKPTPAVKDALQATIGENVGLIKSIAEKHLTEVEGLVMRSVMSGRDLGSLSEQLIERYHVTKRRAALISRDQNNKATAVITRVRQLEIGVTQAYWRHSSAGKVPRPSHVKAGQDKVIYDVREGWYDPDEGRKIFPGELINCRCISAPIIPGLE